eukprot:1771869-Prymnesium_polylepis.2
MAAGAKILTSANLYRCCEPPQSAHHKFGAARKSTTTLSRPFAPVRPVRLLGSNRRAPISVQDPVDLCHCARAAGRLERPERKRRSSTPPPKSTNAMSTYSTASGVGPVRTVAHDAGAPPGAAKPFPCALVTPPQPRDAVGRAEAAPKL